MAAAAASWRYVTYQNADTSWGHNFTRWSKARVVNDLCVHVPTGISSQVRIENTYVMYLLHT